MRVLTPRNCPTHPQHREDGGGLDDTGGGGAERDIAADDRQKPLDAGTQSILLRQQVAQAMDTTGRRRAVF